MSRADKERAIYINKLNLIMENLLGNYPDLKEKHQVKEKLSKQIEDELKFPSVKEEDSGDSDNLDEEEVRALSQVPLFKWLVFIYIVY